MFQFNDVLLLTKAEYSAITSGPKIAQIVLVCESLANYLHLQLGKKVDSGSWRLMGKISPQFGYVLNLIGIIYCVFICF